LGVCIANFEAGRKRRALCLTTVNNHSEIEENKTPQGLKRKKRQKAQKLSLNDSEIPPSLSIFGIGHAALRLRIAAFN